MVVKMMKWSPWPPPAMITKRFQVKTKVSRLELSPAEGEEEKVIKVEIRWKGQKSGGLVSLRRREEKPKQRRNITETKRLVPGFHVVEFGDEFDDVFEFSILQKDNSFNACHVSVSLLYGTQGEEGHKLSVVGTLSLNLAEIAMEMQKEEVGSMAQRKLSIPLQLAGVASEAMLYISFSLVEVRTSQESQEPVQEDSFLRRVTSYVSSSRRYTKNKKMEDPGKEAEDETRGSVSGRFIGDTDDSGTCDPEDSPDDDLGPTQPAELAYSSIASSANRISVEPEAGPSVYYSSRSSGSPVDANINKETSSETELQMSASLLELPQKSGFLSWKKRRLSFRSGKKKEEPLLKKGNGDEGGDDIDMVRRQFTSSSDESTTSSRKKREEKFPEKLSSESAFGDEGFKVGSWEDKELISRDGQAKLKAFVFSATIDQRSESAAGGSACTALVAVIADWLHANQGAMPTRSELDSLIREGSSEWRKLCDDESYSECFPDKHFDLETVLQAKVRSISVIPEKSFVGFFSPERFEFLQGAMSFDVIWDEITANARDSEQQVYIVSWNDHFFVLKVAADVCFIIDTLGERLFEGCNQAYILRFDNETRMYRSTEKVSDGSTESPGKESDEKKVRVLMGQADKDSSNKEDEELICSGRECCREFIKRFLAAIPLREVETEVKKRNTSSIPLHHRLQIEFHYSMPLSSSSSPSSSSPPSPMTALTTETVRVN